MFRKTCPLAWSFHRNSSRWPHNQLKGEHKRQEVATFAEYPELPLIELPPAPELGVSLSASLRGRFSCRRFVDRPASLEALAGTLFWGYGNLGVTSINDVDLVRRPVPSGGGLYPLELYLIARNVSDLAPGLYHYQALHHALEQLREGILPPTLLTELFMAQPWVAEASFVLVIVSNWQRSLWKYEDRGYRYLLLEAGHLAQNVNLSAAALGLGSVNLGGFFDLDLVDLFSLDPEEGAPLYGIAVGSPADGSPEFLRVPEGESLD